MKYVFLLFVWIVFLVILTLFKVSVIIKFLPYILIVTFFALAFATYKTIHDDVKEKNLTKKENENE